jgi:hypothetical protein
MIPKNQSFQVVDHLHSDEIKCKCNHETCHYTIVAGETISKFEELREMHGKPIRINSFYRCQKHNEEVGGVSHSSHTTGLSFDVDTSRMANEEKEDFVFLARSIFDYVKVYANFIHCQLNPTESNV